ncbi:phage head closure protein [Tissierella sp.]|uniref:phage head closure protein n=1 Tax=Tissierella sp. TaxID=41274 RepID=UPI003037BBE4
MNLYQQPYNLRNRITIQKKVESTEPFQSLDDYEDHIKLWSEARFLRGRNFYNARAANVKTDVEFVVRYRTDLKETMRVMYKNRNYEIEGIIPLDNSNSFLMIKAYEIKYDM